MRIRLMFAVCCVLLLCGVAPSFAQNRVDIVLEGPWILYQDHDFLNGKNTVDVLIAMTPGITMAHPHKQPSFSTGDGVWIYPGVYCVEFDQSCATERPAKALSSHDYAELMQPQAADGWNWLTYNNANNDASFLILPMPDSLRNDGVYHVRFSSKFASGYARDEQHSIGVVLHYENGPQKLGLAKCTPKPHSPINATNCANPALFDNTDTLKIVMQAPDDNDACDFHVRSAYPKMLDMIGGRSQNPEMGYIDPAISVNKGKGIYAADLSPVYDVCYQCDPQDPNYPNNCPPGMKEQPAKSLASLLDEMNHSITELEDLPERYRKQFYAPQLRTEFNNLNKLYPSISQFLAIQLLMRLSVDQIEILDSSIKANAPSTARSGVSDVDPMVLEKVEKDEEKVAADIPTKNGGDCRAPVMIVQ